MWGMGVCYMYVTLYSLFQSIIMADWMTARSDALNTCYGIVDTFY
jgi:hypothetical protein